MNDFLMTAEIESLIQGYVEGELTASECARFDALLKASPRLVEPILVSLRADALIRGTVLQVAKADLETTPDRDTADVETVALPESKVVRRIAIGFAIAACLVIVSLGAMLFGPGKTLRLFTRAVQPTGTGAITYEYWNGIPGGAVVDLTLHPAFQEPPTGTELLPRFAAPS